MSRTVCDPGPFWQILYLLPWITVQYSNPSNGNEKQQELAGNSSYWGKFQWNHDQGKGNLVRVSRKFELSEFELSRFYCILFSVFFWRSNIDALPFVPPISYELTAMISSSVSTLKKALLIPITVYIAYPRGATASREKIVSLSTQEAKLPACHLSVFEIPSTVVVFIANHSPLPVPLQLQTSVFVWWTTYQPYSRVV